MNKSLAATLTALFLLSACAHKSLDSASAITIPEAWSQALGSSDDVQTITTWWTLFDDADLTDIVTRARVNNVDLASAVARVQEARAQRGVSAAARYPSINATVGASTLENSDPGGGDRLEQYNASVDASWELDVFGGIADSVKAADADLRVREAELDDVLVSLTAEAALAYIDLRTFQARLNSANANLTAQAQTYDLARWRAQTGLGTTRVQAQAEVNLESTRAQIPILQNGIQSALNRISVLTGEAPGALGQLLQVRDIPTAPQALKVEAPAEVLRRRPDIRAAEQAVAAQAARVGAATADLYPRFQLSGSIGVDTLSSSDLWTLDNWIDRLIGNITGPIFNAGARRQSVEVQSARLAQSHAAYQRTVLLALEEVENALSDYNEELNRQLALTDAVAAANRNVVLSEYEFDAGLSDLDNVLDAQRTLLSLEDQLASSDGAVSTNLVRLYKSMGGGWQPN